MMFKIRTPITDGDSEKTPHRIKDLQAIFPRQTAPKPV